MDQHAEAPVLAEPITAMAWLMGEERLLSDMEMLMHFIGESAGGEREPSWFGPISTEDLVSKIMFNPRASDEQIAQATKEFGQRYLNAHPEYIREAAERAMR